MPAGSFGKFQSPASAFGHEAERGQADAEAAKRISWNRPRCRPKRTILVLFALDQFSDCCAASSSHRLVCPAFGPQRSNELRRIHRRASMAPRPNPCINAGLEDCRGDKILSQRASIDCRSSDGESRCALCAKSGSERRAAKSPGLDLRSQVGDFATAPLNIRLASNSGFSPIRTQWHLPSSPVLSKLRKHLRRDGKSTNFCYARQSARSGRQANTARLSPLRLPAAHYSLARVPTRREVPQCNNRHLRMTGVVGEDT